MKAVDPKLDNVYISMLEHHDIEKIICGHHEENNILLFSPLQLLEMLGDILDRVSSLQQVSISSTFYVRLFHMKVLKAAFL